jgi:hypothetical protein
MRVFERKSLSVTLNNNNFIQNSNQATFDNRLYLFVPLGRNIWINNYRSDWKTSIPRPIKGSFSCYPFFLAPIVGVLTFTSFQFDLHPAQEPYDILGMS